LLFNSLSVITVYTILGKLFREYIIIKSYSNYTLLATLALLNAYVKNKNYLEELIIKEVKHLDYAVNPNFNYSNLYNLDLLLFFCYVSFESKNDNEIKIFEKRYLLGKNKIEVYSALFSNLIVKSTVHRSNLSDLLYGTDELKNRIRLFLGTHNILSAHFDVFDFSQCRIVSYSYINDIDNDIESHIYEQKEYNYLQQSLSNLNKLCSRIEDENDIQSLDSFDDYISEHRNNIILNIKYFIGSVFFPITSKNFKLDNYIEKLILNLSKTKFNTDARAKHIDYFIDEVPVIKVIKSNIEDTSEFYKRNIWCLLDAIIEESICDNLYNSLYSCNIIITTDVLKELFIKRDCQYQEGNMLVEVIYEESKVSINLYNFSITSAEDIKNERISKNSYVNYYLKNLNIFYDTEGRKYYNDQIIKTTIELPIFK